MLVQHFLENSADRLGDKVFLICGDTHMTYAGIDAAADRLASALLEMGVARQDRVIIFLDNSIESVIAMFGIMSSVMVVWEAETGLGVRSGVVMLLSASMPSSPFHRPYHRLSSPLPATIGDGAGNVGRAQ